MLYIDINLKNNNKEIYDKIGSVLQILTKGKKSLGCVIFTFSDSIKNF